jgi:hypothetical protein
LTALVRRISAARLDAAAKVATAGLAPSTAAPKTASQTAMPNRNAEVGWNEQVLDLGFPFVPVLFRHLP